jgi:murein DD-endopeptidase MepM/ murein hydrolase activator NlpD
MKIRAAALASLVLTSAAVAASTSTPVLAGDRSPRFLSLPFRGMWKMRIQDGWYKGREPHRGLDYIRGRVDEGGTWRRFAVVAAAPGKACAALDDRNGCINGVGTRVVIRHRVDGRTWYTYYGHLDTVSRRIPIGTNRYQTRVKRGEFLGWAGRTGLPGTGLHLHFQVITPPFRSHDPYDIYGQRGAYPNPRGTNGRRCGPDRLFIACPPRPPGVPAATDSTRALASTSWAAFGVAADSPRPAAQIRRSRRRRAPGSRSRP